MQFVPALSVLTSVYKGESFLEGFFKNLRSQMLLPELELVLVLNDPSALELQMANRFNEQNAGQVHILQNAAVETIGASWNRAWSVSKAPYLAVWNIDDCRTPDSLSRQLEILEQNQDVQLCYGDYVSVPIYGETVGKRRYTPDYSPALFQRTFAQGGAFWVFRRDVSQKIGYFDEQFEVGPDMEYSFRMAEVGLTMSRAEGILGYFTDASQGLSTRNGAQNSAVDRTAVQLRYGVLDKIQPQFESAAKSYRTEAVLNFGIWHPLSEFLPAYEKYLRSREYLKWVGLVRNGIRSTLIRLQLLEPLHRLQEKIWKREI